jgi:hypothetical protein
MVAMVASLCDPPDAVPLAAMSSGGSVLEGIT